MVSCVSQGGAPRRVLEVAVHSDAVDSIAWAHRGLRFVSGSKVTTTSARCDCVLVPASGCTLLSDTGRTLVLATGCTLVSVTGRALVPAAVVH